MLEDLREAMPVDGVYLALHGAMAVRNVPRPEAEIARRLREVLRARPRTAPRNPPPLGRVVTPHFFEVDPLQCPRCGQEMHIVAFIIQPEVIDRILTHRTAAARRRSRAPPRLLSKESPSNWLMNWDENTVSESMRFAFHPTWEAKLEMQP